MNGNLDYKLKQVTGADTHVKSLNDRIAQTPVTNVVWSGGRGVSKCYPTDKDRIILLNKYGQTYVMYDRTGEPDFKPFEEVHVQISDMTNERGKNFKNANTRLLKTEWAKEKKLTSVKECEDYFSRHHLTWHECSDGVTMRVVDTQINGSFGHSGGVGEIGAMAEAHNFDDGLLRTTGKITGESKILISQKGVQVQQTITDFDVKDNQAINAGVDAVKDAEIEILFISVQNLMSVINDEKTEGEAFKDTAGTVGGIAVTGMVDEVVFDGAGVSQQVVAVALVMKDSFIKYLNTEIDERQFVNEVAQKGIPILIGNIAGILTGCDIVAQMLVTYACTLIYNEIQTIICDYKSIKSMQKAYLERLERVSREMINELHTQKFYLKEIFESDAIEWNDTIEAGFDLIDTGNKEGDMQTISKGIDNIMKLFNSEVRFKDVKEVREFFSKPDRVFKL
jgi:hypothetical protein